MSENSSFGFLGEEFLTWLWFRIETEGGDFEVSHGRSIGVSFDDFLCLAPAGDEETTQTLRAGTPTRTSEARAGLRNGRRLQQAKLILALGELQWQFVLDGPSMTLRSIKLPDDDPESNEPGDRSRERAANFALVHELLEQVYGQFLRIRLKSSYLSNEGEAQAHWMASR